MHPLFLLVPTKTTIKIFPLTNLWHTLDEVSPSQLTTADHQLMLRVSIIISILIYEITVEN